MNISQYLYNLAQNIRIAAKEMLPLEFISAIKKEIELGFHLHLNLIEDTLTDPTEQGIRTYSNFPTNFLRDHLPRELSDETIQQYANRHYSEFEQDIIWGSVRFIHYPRLAEANKGIAEYFFKGYLTTLKITKDRDAGVAEIQQGINYLTAQLVQLSNQYDDSQVIRPWPLTGEGGTIDITNMPREIEIAGQQFWILPYNTDFGFRYIAGGIKNVVNPFGNDENTA